MTSVTFRTSRGDFVADLFPDEAPATVRNFRELASEGFFDGIAFHRVIPGFVIQGGDPLTKTLPLDSPKIGTGGPGYTIPCETRGNPHRHRTGALSMAHAGRDTGGSQFFVVLDEASARHLDGVHTVFGQVRQGMEVVQEIRQGDRIEKVELSPGQSDSPNA
jgi:peptidyl-prolyl cis-trans isomerase B (cyclophilin B)